jgi:phosphatidylglycerophosphate synthase
MSYWLLNAITATRLVVCVPVWLWCWWKRPRGMVLWMLLDLVWFVGTDFLDGNWARENHLDSELGFWLDHSADFLFFGAMALTVLKGSREPAARRPDATRARGKTPTPPSAEPPPPPPPPAPQPPPV